MKSLVAIHYEIDFQFDDFHAVIAQTFSADGIRLRGIIHKTRKPDLEIALAWRRQALANRMS